MCVRNREDFLNYNIEYISYEHVDVETKGAPFKRYVENPGFTMTSHSHHDHEFRGLT